MPFVIRLIVVTRIRDEIWLVTYGCHKKKNHTKMDGCDQKIKIKIIDENERGPKSSIRFLKRRFINI